MAPFLNKSDEILKPKRREYTHRSSDPGPIRTIGITSPHGRHLPTTYLDGTTLDPEGPHVSGLAADRAASQTIPR